MRAATRVRFCARAVMACDPVTHQWGSANASEVCRRPQAVDGWVCRPQALGDQVDCLSAGAHGQRQAGRASELGAIEIRGEWRQTWQEVMSTKCDWSAGSVMWGRRVNCPAATRCTRGGRLQIGQDVEVEGALRRRFFRTAAGVGSRYEVEARSLTRLRIESLP